MSGLRNRVWNGSFDECFMYHDRRGDSASVLVVAAFLVGWWL